MSTSDRPLLHDPGPDIFVSYRRTDKEFVEKLVPVLESLGPSVWWDADIEGGADWRDSIVEHLAASRCLVIVFSEACNTSKQLRKELSVADYLDKDVIPVLIEETEPRGFFLYELAPLNWISIYPSPLGKLDSVAQLLVERLETAGWTALPVVAPAEVAPQLRAAPTDGADVGASSAPVETPVVPFAPPAPLSAALLAVPAPPEGAPLAPPVPPEVAPFAPPATTLPPPAPPRLVPPSAAAAAAPPTTVTDRTRLGLREAFPFRRVDFILPTLVAGAYLLGRPKGDGVGATLGGALGAFVGVLAITGMIAFPIRYYRRRCNPYRVARNLVVSNVVFAVVVSVGFAPGAKSLTNEGETVNATRIQLAFGFLMFGLIFAAISFVLFLLLSRRRAKKTYKDSIEQL